MIDTDKAIQELAEGDSFTEEQARRIVRIVARADERAATAKDLEQLEKRLSQTLEHTEERLSQAIETRAAQTEAKLTNRMYTAVAVIAALLAVFEFLV